MAILVDLKAVTARTAERALFEDLSLTVADGDRLGVVGINGTGKSTLLRLVAGVEDPATGRVARGRDVRVGYLAQEPVLPAGSVGSVVGTDWTAAATLDRLGMGASIDRPVSELSGGQAKRVALASVLTHPADLLVLDEPTNHLDLATVAWLEARLVEHRGGLVLVSHDRHLLDRVTTRMVELDRGHHHLHTGGYASYLEARALREEHAATSEATRKNLARRELAWLRRGAPARSRKPRARIDAAVALVERRPEAAARAGDLEMTFGSPRLGTVVVECRAVGYAYPPPGTAQAGDPVVRGDAARPGARPVLDGVDLTLDRRDRLGIVGANGSGKSTLLDLLAGRRRPTAGTVVTGSTAVVGYYDQRGADLDPRARVRDAVAGSARVPGSPEDVALMNRFWFGGELAWAQVATLSGGERRRLQLLLVLAGRPNVLLLDEPTNDFDLDTLRVLEDFLDDWPGALVVVSHDRTFLERTTERVVALGPDGHAEPVPGGVAAWIVSQQLDRRANVPSTGGGTPQKPPSPGRAPSARRSASTIARLMRDTDKEMTRLTRRRDELAAAMDATTDHVGLARLGAELAAAGAELVDAEERWLALGEEAETPS